jgi:zinc protease
MTTPILRTTALAALLFALGGSAQAALNLDQPIPAGPQVKIGKLANGLTYYIQKNAKPADKAELRLVVKAGSVLEDADQQGLAHLVEHMAFNGSTHFKKHELLDYLQSIGVKFGADLNAYTSFDETVYILPIPTDRKDNLDKGFTVLEDWAGGLSFLDQDIDKERDIVLEEARLGKGAQDRINKVLLPKIFNGSKYAERLPIGKEDVIRHASYDTLRRFYRDWYRPDLMAVIAVGDIDPAEAEKMIQAHFSQLKNPAHERARPEVAIPTRAASEGLVVTDKEVPNDTLMIRYPLMHWIDHGTLRDYREGLVENLFAQMLGQRLQELTQQAEPPFLGANSGVSKMLKSYKSFSSIAALGHGGPQPAITALVQESERARQFGFTAAEFERARKNMMRGYERMNAERDKTESSSYVGEYVRNFLENEPVPGPVAEYQYAQELVPSITLEEINRFARATIPTGAAKLVALIGGDKHDQPLPAGAQLLASVNAAEKNTVAAHTEKALASSLLPTPPKAGSIVAETTDAAVGITTLTLSNGVKVMLKPTDFKNDQVLMGGYRLGGQYMFGDKDIYNARYANFIVGAMGMGAYSPLDLQKLLAGKTAGVRFAMGGNQDVVSGSAGNDDVETLLQMVYLNFTGVRRDPDLYKSTIGRQQDAARNLMAQPEAQFRDAIVSAIYGDNPRVPRMPRPEDFDKINLDRALDVYKERFGSAKGMTFAFVGAFDLAKMKPLVATYLGGLPVADLPIAVKDPNVRPVTGVVKKDVRAGSEQKSIVSMTFTGPASFSEEESMRFHAMLDVMNIRITDELREKLTLIYSGNMSGQLAKYPYANYTIGATLPCGPENVDKVVAAITAEIRKMQDAGPQASDLDKVKQNWLQNHSRAMRENGYWLGRIESAVINGTDVHTVLDYGKRVDAITPAEIQAAAKRYFNLGNYVQVVLYPQATTVASGGSPSTTAK